MDDTAGWLKPSTRRRSGSAGDSLDPGAVAARIQELLCDSRSASEALVRLRGAQAAYFRAGWLVDFSPQLIDPDSGFARVGPCTRRQHGCPAPPALHAPVHRRDDPAPGHRPSWPGTGVTGGPLLGTKNR